MSFFGSKVCLLNWCFLFLNISPLTPGFYILFYLALTTWHDILPCLTFALTVWCLYSPSGIRHATQVLPLNENRFLPLPLFQFINEMLNSNRFNIQSCITTFSKLSTHHCFPPLSKLSITINIYGFLESFLSPFLNGHAKINVSLSFREFFPLFWNNNGIIILQWMRNSKQRLTQASKVC